MSGARLAGELREVFPCPHCGGRDALAPGVPERLYGSQGLVLQLQCEECSEPLRISASSRVRIRRSELAAVNDADSDDGIGQQGEEELQERDGAAPEGSYCASAVTSVLAAMLSGMQYRGYSKHAVAHGIRPMTQDTFRGHVIRLSDYIRRVCDEALAIVRYALVRYGDLHDSGLALASDLVVTSDWFWQTRGHYSANGSGTICEISTGGILFRQHYCKTTVSHSTEEAYTESSRSMDANGFREMLALTIQWMEEEVQDVLDEYQVNTRAKFSGVVLDGDATTDIHVHTAREAAIARGSPTCSDLQIRPCVNHLAKNIGKQAGRIGATFHTSCSCPRVRHHSRSALLGRTRRRYLLGEALRQAQEENRTSPPERELGKGKGVVRS